MMRFLDSDFIDYGNLFVCVFINKYQAFQFKIILN